MEMDTILKAFLQGIFTGKLAWVKVSLGVLSGVLVELGDLSAIMPDKAKPYVAAAVGLGAWLSTHGFHKATPPAK